MMRHFEKIRQVKFTHLGRRQLMMLITSILVGFLIVMQAKSFADVTTMVGRDTRADVFREIKILKSTNEKLSSEITDLEGQLDKMTDNEKALEGIKQEIEKYRLLTGRVNVAGPGISLAINGEIKAIWLTDTVNELFNAGAEAVSLNGIRLTDATDGFDTIPNGQIVLNGAILKKPFTFTAIGDKKVLQDALEQPQGILQRLRESLGGVDYKLEQSDRLEMEKVM